MKRLIKRILSRLVRLITNGELKNYIVFESVPDCSDNTRAVFDEMLRKDINATYMLIWLVDSRKHKIGGIKNVKAISKKSLMKHWYLLTAKCLISCNQKIQTHTTGQYSIYLGHGMPIKSLRVSAPRTPERIDNWIAMSEGMLTVFSYEFNLPVEKGLILGYPRNDEFYNDIIDLHKFFKVNYKKVIVWYPTFRQNWGGISASNSNIALPIIHTTENAIEVNEIAKQNEVLIVIKPHFAQDLDFLLDLNLSNIVFINETFLHDNGVSSYQFVHSCDALLTDYSSIYFDYLIARKPIGLVWEDYHYYEQRPGFAIDMKEYMAGGEKLYTVEDLKLFILRISNGVDLLMQEREEICRAFHKYDDGKSAERVVDHIISHIS